MKNHRVFLIFACVFLALVVFQTTAFAKDEWLRVRSKNFNLVGNASEKDIRKVATKLEQFRETFRQLFNKTNVNSPIPTNVVVFRNGSAFKPFKPKRADGKTDNFVAGYFQPGEDINYIALSTEGKDADTYGTIFHEYVHFVLETNFGKSDVPSWFNEGLAEYYQTFSIEEDHKITLGLLQNSHLSLLQQIELIPLETLFGISNYALQQNGSHSRSIFYAQSWALVHYLIMGGKGESLGKFLALLTKNVPAEKAFQEVFQITYAQMEKDLKKYVKQSTYQSQVITLKNKLVFDSEMQVAPLTEAETNAYLGDLLYHTNRADDAEAYLQKAVALAPDLSMANTTYGMVKLRQRKYDEAKSYLEKAISQDQKNHLALYRYAYLLSRENRDEYGYVSAFPAETSAKMREILKKAIEINPGFTESYELLAFISLVNRENLDEAVSYLQKALKYQPGNQRYLMRIAEIYMRQDKFAEAAAIADKIAKTADKPETKSQAENLAAELRQRQEMMAQQDAARKQYEAARGEAGKSGGQPNLVRRTSGGKTLSPEEIAKARDEAKMLSVNQALRKPAAGEKQIIGRIQKIECKGKIISYAVKTDGEAFTLTSRDFENLALTAFVADAQDVEIGCGTDLAAVNAVLTYKPQADAKAGSRGELIAVDFVPQNFRFMDAAEIQAEADEISAGEETAQPSKNEDSDAPRRAAMAQAIKNSLRQPQTGERREFGLIEKVECSNKGMFFHFKTQAKAFVLAAKSAPPLQIRAFTPEVEQIRFGCGLKQVDIPVIFTYKDALDLKSGADGELVALEFVPKSFVLEK